MTKNNSSATKRLTIESASIGSHGTERSTPPANAPDGGVWGTIKYNGEKSRKRNAVGCAFLIIPGLFMMGCPKDEKDAYSVWEEVRKIILLFIEYRLHFICLHLYIPSLQVTYHSFHFDSPR